MGYCMSLEDAVFSIPKSNHAPALAKIKALMQRTEFMRGGDSRGNRWFSWVDTQEVLSAQTLAEAMEAFRWPVDHDADGNVTSVDFTGEKLGEDQHLFGVLAEFVADGSFVEMRGEDGALWRWVFSGGQVAEKHATVSWE